MPHKDICKARSLKGRKSEMPYLSLPIQIDVTA